MEEVSFPMQSLTEAYKAKQLLTQNRIVCRIDRKTDPRTGCGYDVAVMREDAAEANALLRQNRLGRRN